MGGNIYATFVLVMQDLQLGETDVGTACGIPYSNMNTSQQKQNLHLSGSQISVCSSVPKYVISLALWSFCRMWRVHQKHCQEPEIFGKRWSTGIIFGQQLKSIQSIPGTDDFIQGHMMFSWGVVLPLNGNSI